jgi:hypothetical protein
MKNGIIKCVGFVLCLFSLGAGAGAIYSGPGATDVDSDPATTVSFDVWEHGTIFDVDVTVHIVPDPSSPGDFHPEDLVIGISHAGVDVQLTPSALGGHSDTFAATFDDESLNFFPILGDINGTYQSVDLLSAFLGLDVYGTWTLSIYDPFEPGEGADLASWYLQVGHAPEPASTALIAIALSALGFSRRRYSS